VSDQGAAGAGRGARTFFCGATQLALDGKGRLAIPARHRDALAPRLDDGTLDTLILTVDPSHCLLLYPRATWGPIQERLMSLSSFNAEVRNLQRLLVGYASAVEMDGAGRILVAPSLRRFAALDHHVVLVGQGNKFELWDEAKWGEATARAVSFPAGTLPPELDGFSL
jgi:MraZ protein